MSVSPLPRVGGVHVDRHDPTRALRVTAHPHDGLVSISMWRDNRCVATHRVAAADVPQLITMLAEALAVTAPATDSAAS